MAARTILWAPFLLFFSLTVFLSHQPNVPGASLLPDYVLHAIEFMTLTGLLLRALSGSLLGPHAPGALLAALLFGGAYGIIDEVHQSFIPGRDSSVKDVAVDVAATTATALAAAAVSARRKKPGEFGAELAPPCGLRRGMRADVAQEARARSPRVELFTRDGCHLCDEAKAALTAVLGEAGVAWKETDIAGNREMSDRYGQEIPVVLVDGVKRFKGRVDPERLVKLLAERNRLRGGSLAI